MSVPAKALETKSLQPATLDVPDIQATDPRPGVGISTACRYLSAAAATGVAVAHGTADRRVTAGVAVVVVLAGLPVTLAVLVGGPAPLASITALVPAPAVLAAAEGLGGTTLEALTLTGQDVGGQDRGGLQGGKSEGNGELHCLSSQLATAVVTRELRN